MDTIADVAREILFSCISSLQKTKWRRQQMYLEHANDAADLIGDFQNFLTPRLTADSPFTPNYSSLLLLPRSFFRGTKPNQTAVAGQTSRVRRERESGEENRFLSTIQIERKTRITIGHMPAGLSDSVFTFTIWKAARRIGRTKSSNGAARE